MQLRALLHAVTLALTLVAAAPVAVDSSARSPAPMKYSAPDAAGVFPYKREEGADTASATTERDPELVDPAPNASDEDVSLEKRIRYAVVKRAPLPIRYAVVKRAADAEPEPAPIRYAVVKREAEPAPIRYAVVKREADPEPIRYAVVKREADPEPARYAAVKRDAEPEPIRYAVVKREADPEPIRYAVVKREPARYAAVKREADAQFLPAGHVAEANLA